MRAAHCSTWASVSNDLLELIAIHIPNQKHAANTIARTRAICQVLGLSVPHAMPNSFAARSGPSAKPVKAAAPTPTTHIGTTRDQKYVAHVSARANKRTERTAAVTHATAADSNAETTRSENDSLGEAGDGIS